MCLPNVFLLALLAMFYIFACYFRAKSKEKNNKLYKFACIRNLHESIRKIIKLDFFYVFDVRFHVKRYVQVHNFVMDGENGFVSRFEFQEWFYGEITLKTEWVAVRNNWSPSQILWTSEKMARIQSKNLRLQAVVKRLHERPSFFLAFVRFVGHNNHLGYLFFT